MATNPFITAPQFYNTFEPRLRPRRDARVAGAEYRNALAIKNDLATTVRRATANAQAEDAARKIALFESMTPDQLAGVYSRAPQTPEEEEIQRTIAGYENAGNAGFQLGFNSDRRVLDDNRRTAVFDRSIRDSDLNYNLRLEAADRANEEFDRRYDNRDAQLDLQQQKQADLNAYRAGRAQSSSYRDAENAVLNDAVESEADIPRMFPMLDASQRESLRGLMNARTKDRRQLFTDASKEAGEWEARLKPLRESADAMAKRTYEQSQPGWFSRNYLGRQGTNPTERGITSSEQELIDLANKRSDGAIVYDPELRTFVPAPSISQSQSARPQPTNPFYTPTIRGASPNRPIASNVRGDFGPQPAMNPILGAFNVLERGGAAPVDADVARLNQRFPRVREGASMNQGQFVFRGGKWVRTR